MKLTATGKIWLLLLIITSVASFITILIPLYHIPIFLFMVWIFNYILSIYHRPYIKIKGQIPQKGVATLPLKIKVLIENTGKRCCFSLFPLVEQKHAPKVLKLLNPKEITHLNSDETISYIITIIPTKRGIYNQNQLYFSSDFPFGLRQCQSKEKIEFNLIVYPHFFPLETLLLPNIRKYQPGGLSFTSNIGESPEYIGCREYRTGDSFKKIDHRAWARTGSPAVKEYQEEYFVRIAIVLDTQISSEKSFEAALSITAAIADKIRAEDYIIDLFAAGEKLYIFRSGRHITHLENIMEILACIDGCQNNPFEDEIGGLENELSSITCLIGVFQNWDNSRKKIMHKALYSGCSVKTIIVEKAIENKVHNIPDEFSAEFLDTEEILKGNITKL